MIDGEEYGIAVGGMYNVYNALAATSVAEYYQVAPDKIRAGLAYDEKVFLGVKKPLKLVIKNVR